MIPIKNQDTRFITCLGKLQAIRTFSGDPAQFWTLYLDILVELCAADCGMIAVMAGGDETQWQQLAFSPPGDRLGEKANILKEKLPQIAAEGKEAGSAIYKGTTWTIVACDLKVGLANRRCIALFFLPGTDPKPGTENLSLLSKLNDLPELYQIRKSISEALQRQEQLAGVLDLMVLVNEQEKFLSAAMTFCNELAARHHCERVSLGWQERGYVRLKAMSHVDTFEKKMDTVQKLELAMEEALDQAIEIVLPYHGETMIVSKNHESYCRAQDVKYICTFPLRVNGAVVALCTLERNTAEFIESEIRLVRLSCDQATRRLDDLKKSDQWFGKLIVNKTKKMLVDCIGFEHVWAKALGLLIGLSVCFILFVPVRYRLESTSILRTDNVSFLTAPFDGHIESVSKRIGDDVKTGEELMRLDQSDLLLQQAELEAEKTRYGREAEKSEASNAFADMLIAQALRDQTAARLEIVVDKIKRSVMAAPFDGCVVEGDLLERIGSPVKQGDVVFKIARLEGLYIELEVKESEIHNAQKAKTGEIALSSRPQEKHGIEVVRIEPAAVEKKDGNIFIVRCTISGKIPSWWRPGMTGVGKLNAGRRTLLWIFTHRTVDFLRLKLWW